MKLRVALLSCGLAAFLSGCANLQGMKVAEVPEPLKSAEVALSPLRPPPTIVFRAMEIPDRSVFLKQTAGGSLAVGLLLGPLGGLANEANIERLSKELAQNSKGSSLLQLDAIEEAAAAWGERPKPADPKSLQLRPYVVLYPDNGRKNVTVIAGVFVTSSYKLSGDKVWNANYHYVLPSTPSFDVLEHPMQAEQLAAFKAELRDGLRQIRTELLRDLSPVQPQRRVAVILADALRVSSIHMVGFIGGDIETDASGRMVIRANMSSPDGGTAGALRDAPHQVWMFPKSGQYRFDSGPEERKSK